MRNMIHVAASMVIDARPEVLYAVVTDYQVGHPAILPKQYFTGLTVEKGGRGAGTVVRGSVKVFGTEYPFHQQVSEPEPGRVVQETDIDTGQYTTFTFEPLNGGTQTRVTIASEFPPSPGLMGWMERLVKPGVTQNIYKQELRQLAEYVYRSGAAVSVP
ncbi:MAG: SRPBCC family protein [Chloroflexi bacterium]|nr:SRPBCC family protein [Chloroflexota bacterium]